ncbi:hypothetical protein N867_05635 [Actinotalea fermentans ATCC 43279 = JCM 9966 = DSM 3133]|nr:hypothetical protein N867_05635 [Actinotalea fermentans ATCC 43279 = JCM 9966 = DSM 3133]
MRRGTLQVVMTVLSLCATSVALSGCSDPAAPPPTTPPATSAAPSPSATPTPTPTPDAATPPERPDMSQVDAATAEAVATYFLELYPYAYATGDLTEWRALSHPECIFCASVITNVEQMVAAGEHWEGGTATIESAEVVASVPEAFDVTVVTVEEPSILVDADGITAKSADGGRGTSHVIVTAHDGDWRVREIEVE